MGKLSIVGIGPGNYENMTIKADRALQSCDVIIGYHVYVDLVKERYPNKEFLTTPMTDGRPASSFSPAPVPVCSNHTRRGKVFPSGLRGKP